MATLDVMVQRARIGVRLALLILLFASCVVAHYLWLALGRPGIWPSPWPRRFLGIAARIAGVRVRVVGTLAAAPRLLLANHQSWIDVLAIAGATGSAFVAHDGLSAHRLLCWLCRLNHTIFIARHDRGSVAAQAGQLRDALAGGGTVTLFPEGTTADGTALNPFKSALLAAVEPSPPGLAVQPVRLDYGPESAAIAWVGAEPGAANVLRILARRAPIELVLQFLRPLDPQECTSRKVMAAAAQTRIEHAMRQSRAGS